MYLVLYCIVISPWGGVILNKLEALATDPSTMSLWLLLVPTFTAYIVLAAEETTVVQRVNHRPIKCQSRSWSRNGDNPQLRSTGIQIATKPLPGPTNREHRKFIGVKTISLGTNYSFYCLEYCLQCLMGSASNKVIKSNTKSFLAPGGLHEDIMATLYEQWHQPINQCQNGSSNLLTPYREQPRSTRNIVAYPRPAFSATKRTNHAPISFDQQAQVS